MTKLSVNINKIALLRNSRGRDYPNVIDFAKRFIDLGVHGITVHPRQDERHIKVKDAYEIAEFLSDYPKVEFNIEGYPTLDFMKIIRETKPDQCTLVPDAVNQVTSDHGWNVGKHKQKLTELAVELKDYGVRSAVFLDPDVNQVQQVVETGMNRIELYTEEFAKSFNTKKQMYVLENYRTTTSLAQSYGLGVNAGHDLDSKNLATFLQIQNILEVSIGHVLTIECLEQGMEKVIKKYLEICNRA